MPEGEDPDSFARQHDATEVLEYFKAHQTDFIRLKAQLLSEDAGDDPVKRADMITQIVQSIAIIPDIIKRQIYIKDCSTNLGIQESVLTRKVIELRKKYLEDRKKRASVIPSSSGESTESPMEGTTVERDVEATPSISNGESKLSLKDQNIQNLLQLIVRYGEVVIYQSDTVVICVGEYIINELRKDNVEMKNPTYQLLIDEYMVHYKDPNWIAANYFQYHPDVELSRFAVEMLTDKYQLSRMYAKQMVSENVVKEVAAPSEVDMLPNMVQRMLLELKYTIVNERIDAMKRMLVDAEKRGDWELQRTILAQQPALNAILQELCKALGNRVILH